MTEQTKQLRNFVLFYNDMDTENEFITTKSKLQFVYFNSYINRQSLIFLTITNSIGCSNYITEKAKIILMI